VEVVKPRTALSHWATVDAANGSPSPALPGMIISVFRHPTASSIDTTGAVTSTAQAT
jgi:hypothetical protein